MTGRLWDRLRKEIKPVRSNVVFACILINFDEHYFMSEIIPENPR